MKKADSEKLLKTLEKRFESNMQRHKGLKWDKVLAKLTAQSAKLETLFELESSGGEPDVVGFDTKSKEFIFFDCAQESPSGRRSLCYDKKALLSRKEARPKSSSDEMAKAMGAELMTEEEYEMLQGLGDFDLKTSSWLKTPAEVRDLGGAIYGDKRYDRTFIYHNGAQSYYAVRGFRCTLRV